MQKLFKRSMSMLLALVMLLSSAVCNVAFAADSTKIPQQIALALTSEPQTSISMNWTTIDTSLTGAKVKVWENGTDENTAVNYNAAIEKRTLANSTIKDGSDQTITEKNFYSATVDGLNPDTEYNYRLGTDAAMSNIRTFKTAQSGTEEFSFIYVSDSQVDGDHAKGWNANLDIMKEKYPNSKFIYIAGDLTNTAGNEGQWESFFNQPGNAQYNETYSGSFISEIPTVATMGNHDSSNGGEGGMISHYTWGSEVEGVPVSYAFDYGAARFIILNLENAYSMNDTAARDKQEQFLRQEVTEAKNEGKWVIVGFHKSLYSGANHMDDTDVINNRKYWVPIFAEIGVDTVLQGHDHVLSRGFIKPDGYKLDIVTEISERVNIATAPQNVPLYYTGNTGSTLKFYAPIMNNDWIQEGDPVAPDFGYLDLNSALPAGHELNPYGPCTNDDLDATDPNFYRTPTFTVITVSENAMKYETYMTGFDNKTNTIVEDTFLYDSLTVERANVNLTLASDKNEITPESSVELCLLAKDKFGDDINITTSAAIAYKADIDGILNIATTGTGITTGGAIITVENLPEEDTTVTVHAEVTIGEEIYKSNPIKITVMVPLNLTINSPYESVNWTTFGQYKANFHAHTTESDGGNTPEEMIEDHYAKGFDILAITDHNFTNTAWDRTDRPADKVYLIPQRLAEITAGTDRDNKGMTGILYSNEQSRSDHVNTFFADFNNESGATLEGNIAKADELGGISHINHPGRYTGGSNTTGTAGEDASNNPANISKYVDLFKKYDSLVGMEIINKKDGDSYSDRILWDNILTKTMPELPVWGFSNDDTHSVSATGFSYNIMLLPSNTVQNVRKSMEDGTFYASAKVSKRELGMDFVSTGDTPKITNIVVNEDEDTITIYGQNYNTIEWIANGKIIATGATIDLNDYENALRNYVRAQLKGDGGISFTQPFGIEGLRFVPILDSAELKADGDKILVGSSDKVKLSVAAKDQSGSPISSQDMTVEYNASKDNIVEISADGTVNIKNAPTRNQDIKIYAEVSDATGKVITNEVSITVALPEFEAADGYIATSVKSGNDDVEEYILDGEMYLDSSDLEIVWEKPTSSTDKEEQLIGLRFTELSIPKGAKILDAYIEFTVDEAKNADPFNVNIQAEAAANSSVFTAENKNISNRKLTESSVNWKDMPLWTVVDASGTDQQTPNIAPLVQEVIDMDGWNENNAMTFVIGGIGSRTARAYESSASKAPRLIVTFIKNPDEIKLAVPVKISTDDMEEAADGSLDDGSSDLEIVEESTNQVIGLRFQDIHVPKGAKIVDAYVQFTVDEIKDSKNRDPFNVKIQAENAVNSATFNSALNYDVSSRTKTQTDVIWKDIPKWAAEGLAGEGQRTPNISALIQEIVNKDEWTSGNAISLILSGTGTRTAESFEGAGSKIEERPTLNIVYSLKDSESEEPEQPNDSNDDSDNSGNSKGKETSETLKVQDDKTGSTFTDISDEFWAKQEIEYLASNGVIAGRSSGIFQPQGTVTRAEFAKLITAALNISDSGAVNTFDDVNTSDWYSGYISSAVRSGIINGYTDGTFKPNNGISRLEMAVMAGRALKIKGCKVPENTEQYLAFNDRDLIAYGEEEIALAVQYGIISGRPGNILDPDGVSTRAEAAAIIYRLFTFIGI